MNHLARSSKLPFQQVLFSFEGRISRGQFCLGAVAGFVLAFFVLLAPIALLNAVGVKFSAMISRLLFFLGIAFGFWILAALNVKRWHDLGQTGWMAFTWGIPAANVVVFFWLVSTKGMPGANPYGPDPQTPFDPAEPVPPPAAALGWTQATTDNPCLRDLLFSFKGRISRRVYWLGLGMVVTFMMAGAFAGVFASLVLGLISKTTMETLWYWLFLPPSAFIALALLVKRWHDLNYSGFATLLIFLPIVGQPMVWWIGLIKGTKGANRFGPDPLEIETAPSAGEPDAVAGLTATPAPPRLSNIQW
jgi:uncharacterized membrane protein YhaH (DUF805 family)